MNKRLLIGFLVCALMLFAVGAPVLAHPGGLNTPSPDIPPVIVPGVYLSPSDVHAKYAAGALEIVLSMVEHQPFAALPPRYFCGGPAGGDCDEHHEFNSMLHADLTVNGMSMGQIEMQGMVETVAFDKSPTNPTGTFDTEMLSMMLIGTSPGPMGHPVRVRESPTKQSLGKTSITDIGPPGPPVPVGPPEEGYHIDSFFDVFTELSLDGGATWIKKAGSRGTRVHLEGVPEPASIVLFGLGLVGLVELARRRK